jgi:peptidoglycan hydrolase-like protein with peptidoglycan-binding domain
MLRLGSFGPAVVAWQGLLLELGYDPGPLDGIFGRRTLTATKEAQAALGVTVDGVVGPQTLGSAQAARPGSGPTVPVPDPPPAFPEWPGEYLRRGSRGDAVATWQGQMAARGWTIAADGVFGPQTERVARAFQAEKGLAVDGVVGPDTWAAAWTAPVTR